MESLKSVFEDSLNGVFSNLNFSKLPICEIRLVLANRSSQQVNQYIVPDRPIMVYLLKRMYSLSCRRNKTDLAFENFIISSKAKRYLSERFELGTSSNAQTHISLKPLQRHSINTCSSQGY